jgi:hypothetical protein
LRAVDIIIKKRDHGELTGEEIDFFVQGYTRAEIPDYQAAAWAMAVMLNGMTPGETTDLTLSMANSGHILDLSGIVDVAVDKHSTGGVGDKTTLAVLPIVAACGLPCGKMSGRGLGFSGGTLDKLESIPGYRVDLTTDEFKKQLKEIGIVLTGQSLDLAPADGKFYVDYEQEARRWGDRDCPGCESGSRGVYANSPRSSRTGRSDDRDWRFGRAQGQDPPFGYEPAAWVCGWQRAGSKGSARCFAWRRPGGFSRTLPGGL